MVGYIYLITDTTNGMKYTGKHHYHIEGQLDPSYHGSGVIIKNIYKKRPETLKEEYIKTCYSEEQMCSDEQYYIEVFDTLWPHGYNLTKGGDGVIPSEEVKKKMSNAKKGKPAHNKGKPMSEKQKKKLSDSLKGRTSPMKGRTSPNKGKPMSEEQKKKLSNAHKGKTMSEEQKKKIIESNTNGKLSKPVLQFSLSGEFIREWPSTAECGRNGFDSSFVSSCCRGKYKSAYGYIWRYKEDYS